MFRLARCTRSRQDGKEIHESQFCIIPEKPGFDDSGLLRQVANRVFGPVYVGLMPVYVDGKWVDGFRLFTESEALEHCNKAVHP